MNKLRFVDRFNISPTKRKMTKQGYMHVPANIARPGIQLYRGADLMGSPDFPHDKFTKDSVVKVYRPPEEVFRQASVDSFKNVPVTNEHPPSLLDAKTTAAYQKGSVRGDVSHNHKFVTGTICITDEATIKEINSGKVQVSAGYESYIDFTGGVTEDGETYDACQKDIEGNHVAIVGRGRAGAQVRLSDAAMEVEGLKYMLPKMKLSMGDETYAVSEGSESYNKIGWMFDQSQAEFIRENKVEQEEMRGEVEDEDYNEVNAGKPNKSEPDHSKKNAVLPGPGTEGVDGCGQKAYSKDSHDFDPEQLEIGIMIEKEHTDDPAEAEKIAKDHLKEIPDYYTRLVKMENEAAEAAKKKKSSSMDVEGEDKQESNMDLEKELADVKVQLADALTENETLTAKIDVASAKLEETEAKIPTVDAIDKMVAERMIMLDSVKAFKPEIETAGRSELELKKEIVMDHFPKLTAEKATEAYVFTAFDMLDVPEKGEETDLAKPKMDAMDAEMAEAVKPILVSAKAKGAREKFMARNRDAWK